MLMIGVWSAAAFWPIFGSGGNFDLQSVNSQAQVKKKSENLNRSKMMKLKKKPAEDVLHHLVGDPFVWRSIYRQCDQAMFKLDLVPHSRFKNNQIQQIKLI